MTRKDLLQMVEDEVSSILQTPLTEPKSHSTKKTSYKPVLQHEDDIDDMLFYTGKPPEEVTAKRKKNNKKLLGFGK